MPKKNKTYKIALGIFSGLLYFSILFATAQNRKPTTIQPKQYKGKAYLADGQTFEGRIDKAKFDSLIQLPIVIIDTAGKIRKSINYTVTYAERGLFEDSTGKRKIMADYYSIVAAGGEIPEHWVKGILEITKHNDTAIINNIEFNFADSAKAPIFYAEPIKVIINNR